MEASPSVRVRRGTKRGARCAESEVKPSARGTHEKRVTRTPVYLGHVHVMYTGARTTKIGITLQVRVRGLCRVRPHRNHWQYRACMRAMQIYR